MPTPAVIVEDVTRVFGEGAAERRALDGATLTVRRGEFVAIMGASGSGKSTLLHILGGVDAPTAGRVVVDGMDLSTLGADALALYRRHTVGLVYQFHNLVPFLSVRDNVELPVRFDGSRPDPATVAELLDLLDIADCEKSMPSELSGGHSSAWPSPALSSRVLPSSSPTSPQAASTAKTARRSWAS